MSGAGGAEPGPRRRLLAGGGMARWRLCDPGLGPLPDSGAPGYPSKKTLDVAQLFCQRFSRRVPRTPDDGRQFGWVSAPHRAEPPAADRPTGPPDGGGAGPAPTCPMLNRRRRETAPRPWRRGRTPVASRKGVAQVGTEVSHIHQTRLRSIVVEVQTWSDGVARADAQVRLHEDLPVGGALPSVQEACAPVEVCRSGQRIPTHASLLSQLGTGTPASSKTGLESAWMTPSRVEASGGLATRGRSRGLAIRWRPDWAGVPPRMRPSPESSRPHHRASP